MGQHPRAVVPQPARSIADRQKAGTRDCEMPDWWGTPYGERRACWGCGLKATTRRADRHYGSKPRPLCKWCAELADIALSLVVRPPAGPSGQSRRLPAGRSAIAWPRAFDAFIGAPPIRHACPEPERR